MPTKPVSYDLFISVPFSRHLGDHLASCLDSVLIVKAEEGGLLYDREIFANIRFQLYL